MGALVVMMGLLAIGVGITLARSRLHATHRNYQRTTALATTLAEGWNGWFVGGFSGMTLGLRWLLIAVTAGAWALAGIGLIGFGIQLCR